MSYINDNDLDFLVRSCINSGRAILSFKIALTFRPEWSFKEVNDYIEERMKGNVL